DSARAGGSGRRRSEHVPRRDAARDRGAARRGHAARQRRARRRDAELLAAERDALMAAAPLARAGFLLALLAGCVSEEPAHRSMVQFRAGETVGIVPERVAGTDRGDYSLVYVLSDDGDAI